MKITSIKQQVKRADRYSIFVDGKYCFGLSESGLLNSKIAIGQELTPADLDQLKKLSIEDKLYGNALRYALLRPRSVWEMETYLKRKSADPKDIEKILNTLSNSKYLDDATFADSWVQNRRLLKAVSKRRLVQELKQKRVSDEIIEQTLSNDDTDEHAILRELIVKKQRQTQYRDKTKLMQFLVRQGFNYGDVKEVLAEFDLNDPATQ